MRLLPLLAVAVVVPSLVTCVVQSRSDPPEQGPTPAPTSTTPPEQPMLVGVDTNGTMTNTSGGDGVGVFVEYQAGGHWHVSMTCDTNKSGQNCNFDLKITPVTGSITKYAVAPGTNNPANVAVLSGTTGIEATALMTTEVAAINFDGDPGTQFTIDASVSGLRYYVDTNGNQQTFFFFVEGNKINGGFTGKLTDPLTFEPSSP